MGQLGFFDLNNRFDGLDRKGDPLALLAGLIPWETFRPKLKRALLKAGLRTRPGERKTAAGRKP
jgi:IS5 family transposase